MTSLATLILRLHSLARQSQFHLSQFLGALIHLPRVWRGLHAELHLSSLTWKVLQLTRQLRSESLIRIGAPPILKLAGPQRKLEGEERTSSQPSIPVDLSRMQDSLAILGERIYESHDALPAITRRLFQPVKRSAFSLRLSSASKESSARSRIMELPSQTPPINRPLLSGRETLEEEELREKVVETWLRRAEEAGIRPNLSFAEAHVLYRELFEEFVNAGILPPNQFSQRFLETRGNLTFEQARLDLRTRLNELIQGFVEPSQLVTEREERQLTASPLLPSYIPTALWAKGSLAFGTVTPTRTSIAPTESTQRMSTTTLLPSPPLPERRLLKDSKSLVSREPYAPEPDREPLRNGVFAGTSEEVHPRSLMKTEAERDSLHEIDFVKVVEGSKGPEGPYRLNESIRGDISRDTHLQAIGPGHAEASRSYSPADALISTIALHSKAAFILPSAGSRLLTSSKTDDPSIALLNAFATISDVLTFYQEKIANEGYLSTATKRRSLMKHGRAIGYEANPSPWTIPRQSILVKDHAGQDVSGELSALAPPHERTEERFERPLTIFESRPVAIYLRPPMRLPGGESTTEQRALTMTLPSPNVASTRETVALQSFEPQIEGEAAEGHRAEEEGPDTDAELHENVKRIGRIIAEEARRHIGSS